MSAEQLCAPVELAETGGVVLAAAVAETSTAAGVVEAATLVAALRRLQPEAFAAAQIEELFEIAVRAHAQLSDAGVPAAVLAGGHGLAPTDVVRVASGLLAGAGLEPFELALWNSFGGLPPAAS